LPVVRRGLALFEQRRHESLVQFAGTASGPIVGGDWTHGVPVEIVDLIYETAFVPELLTPMLSQLSRASGSVGSTLFLFAPDGSARGVTLPNLDDLLQEFLRTPDLRFSTSVVRMCETKPNSFVVVDDYMTPAEIEQDPIRQRLRARGIGINVCTAVPVPTGEIAIYVLQKELAQSAYSPRELAQLNELRPHLARLGLVASRMGLERARGTVAALEALGLAAAVCARGRVIAMNDGFAAKPDRLRVGAEDRLSLLQTRPNELLQIALTNSASEAPIVRSIPLSPVEGDPCVIHVLPLKRSALDVFSGGDSVVVYTEVRTSELVPLPMVLSGLFDLTPTEARLAVGLASGLPLKAAAEMTDVKLSTARAYLDQIFRKTGTNQQSQLVALLKSASAVR
jgi:DNA-binding CsgD family transcriptional regulator